MSPSISEITRGKIPDVGQEFAFSAAGAGWYNRGKREGQITHQAGDVFVFDGLATISPNRRLHAKDNPADKVIVLPDEDFWQ